MDFRLNQKRREHHKASSLDVIPDIESISNMDLSLKGSQFVPAE
jgi:hypothetical protein